MKCQILFSRKNKKNSSKMSSADYFFLPSMQSVKWQGPQSEYTNVKANFGSLLSRYALILFLLCSFMLFLALFTTIYIHSGR